jgi:hypothetical protein
MRVAMRASLLSELIGAVQCRCPIEAAGLLLYSTRRWERDTGHPQPIGVIPQLMGVLPHIHEINGGIREALRPVHSAAALVV